jgi:hypothetical protein
VVVAYKFKSGGVDSGYFLPARGKIQNYIVDMPFCTG